MARFPNAACQLGWIVGAGLSVMLAGIAAGGDVTPPHGPVGATMKTLDEVEPRIPINDANTPGDADTMYIINAPGSYYLTERIIGPAGFDGIEVAAPGVTLDLNGFDMVGQTGSGTAIVFTLNAKGGIVRNGSIRLWEGGGVNMMGTATTVKDVRVRGAGFGLIVAGGLISECVAEECNDVGITGSVRTVIVDSVSRNNDGVGIAFGNGSVVSRCVSGENTGHGFEGSHSTLAECSSYDNEGDGYRIGFASLARGCSSKLNTGSGYVLERGSKLVDCTSYGDGGIGIDTGGWCSIRSCLVDLAGDHGIQASTGCVIEDSSISACAGGGIEQPDGQTDMVVRRCFVTSNLQWGIRSRDRALLERNHVTRNGITTPTNYSGIIALGDDAVLRENQIIGNDNGVFLGEVTSVMIDNVIQGNTPLP